MRIISQEMDTPMTLCPPAPDVYFSAGFGAAEVAGSSDRWLLLHEFDGAWQLPVKLSQRAETGTCDASSPYGYSGIYADPEVSARDRDLAWARAREALLERGVCSVFLRRSPLVPQAPPPPGAVSVVEGHLTRLMPLGDQETMWAGMEGRCRTSIRKAERLGLVATLAEATPADVATGSPFRALYEATMARKESRADYVFPDPYYQALVTAPDLGLTVGQVRDEAGEVQAAALFLRHGPRLHYHLSGATERGRASGATNQLVWEAARQAATGGVQVLHLGGGLVNGDSLYKFKRSFGGQDLTYSAVGVVLDKARYDAAVVLRAEQLGRRVEEIRASRVFPAYRSEA